MFYYGEPPPISVILLLLVILVLMIFGLHRCDVSEFKDNWANKTVLIDATQQKGIVIGGGNSRDQGRMLNIRLENGNIIYISAKQVSILPEQKSLKEIEIEKLQMEIQEKKNKLNDLKGTP